MKLDFKKIYQEEHLEKGMSYKEIRNKYNIPRGTWDYHVRQKLGLSNDGRKYRVNDNFFSVIDSEIKAYLLGFLYADGYLTNDGRIGININRKDEEIVKLIQSNICPNNIIEYTNHQDIKRDPQVTIRFTSKKMYSDLEKLGFSLRKTEVDSDIFNKIPFNFKNHFIRGFCDGDGSIRCKKVKSHYKMGVIFTTGSSKILLDIDNYLTKGKGRFTNLETYHRLSYESKEITFQVVNQLYENANFFLNRKFQIAKEIINLNSNTELTKEIKKS
ncbi:MAG: hypothetical protein KC414_10370 [Romboutsia sp.]|nr:hypothetical protein [Romboutsia sp.]